MFLLSLIQSQAEKGDGPSLMVWLQEVLFQILLIFDSPIHINCWIIEEDDDDEYAFEDFSFQKKIWYHR